MKELGINTSSNTNSTYIPFTESFDDISRTNANFVSSVGLEISEEDNILPYLYWTPKLRKTPFKHRFIAGSSKCTAKDLQSYYSTYTERRSASENCIYDNRHCILKWLASGQGDGRTCIEQLRPSTAPP